MSDAPFTVTADAAPADAAQAAQAAAPALPDGASWNDDGSVTLTLGVPANEPVVTNGVAGFNTTTSLTMRRLSGEAMLQSMNARGTGDQARIMLGFSIGRVGPRFSSLLAAMDSTDLLRAMAVVAVFTGNGPTTGQ